MDLIKRNGMTASGDTAYCFEERKSEAARAFGKSKDPAVLQVESYLSDYGSIQKILEVNRYEREFGASHVQDGFFGRGDPFGETESCLQARLYAIRSFVLSIPDTDAKLLLYYHYVHGENLMRCAELLSISRASVYRLKKRALSLAAALYGEQIPGVI